MQIPLYYWLTCVVQIMVIYHSLMSWVGEAGMCLWVTRGVRMSASLIKEPFEGV